MAFNGPAINQMFGQASIFGCNSHLIRKGFDQVHTIHRELSFDATVAWVVMPDCAVNLAKTLCGTQTLLVSDTWAIGHRLYYLTHYYI